MSVQSWLTNLQSYNNTMMPCVNVTTTIKLNTLYIDLSQYLPMMIPVYQPRMSTTNKPNQHIALPTKAEHELKSRTIDLHVWIHLNLQYAAIPISFIGCAGCGDVQNHS